MGANNREHQVMILSGAPGSQGEAPSPADRCENTQEHAQPKPECAYKTRSTLQQMRDAQLLRHLLDVTDAHG